MSCKVKVKGEFKLSSTIPRMNTSQIEVQVSIPQLKPQAMSFPFRHIGLIIKLDQMILNLTPCPMFKYVCVFFLVSIVSSIAHMRVLDTLLAVSLACAIFTISQQVAGRVMMPSHTIIHWWDDTHNSILSWCYLFVFVSLLVSLKTGCSPQDHLVKCKYDENIPQVTKTNFLTYSQTSILCTSNTL